MAAAYRLVGGIVQRTVDNACIPGDPRNRDWVAYRAWLTAGGVPDPYVPPPPPPPTPIVQPGTGNFWAQNGAIINRIRDRVLVGPAADNDGVYPFTNLDWLSQAAAWATNAGQLAVLAGGQPSAIVAGSRQTDNGGITTQSWVLSDDQTQPNSSSWAYYGEGRRWTGCGSVTVMELDAVNYGEVIAGNPYMSGGPKSCKALWLGSGGSAGGLLQDATMALGVVANGAKFRSGIVFCNGSLAGTNGEAIALPQPYRLNWYTGAPPATPVSAIGSSTTGVQLISNGVTAAESHIPLAGEAGLLLAVNRAGTITLSQVKIGAVNSGGTGLRALVVDN